MASFLRSGIEVLNLSFGGPTADGMPPLVLERAVDVLSAEMVLVAAAGNHGDQPEDVGAALHQDITTVPRSRNSPIWPAAMPNVVAVGATDTEDGIASFTPPDVPWLDLVAPGKDVESTFLTGRVEAVTVEVENGEVLGIVKKDLGDFEGTARWSGTSFAAASATGEIARLMQTHQLTAQAAVAEIRKREGGRGTVHGLRQGSAESR
jgi:subtilisin family serine protease